MKSITLKVEGMHCGGCVERIRSALAQQPGVGMTDVSLDEHRAEVMFDPRATSEDQIVAAVR